MTIIGKQISKVIDIVKSLNDDIYQNGKCHIKSKSEIISDGIIRISNCIEMLTNQQCLKIVIESAIKLLLITGETIFWNHANFDKIEHLNTHFENIKSDPDVDDEKLDDYSDQENYEKEKYMFSCKGCYNAAYMASIKYSKIINIDHNMLGIKKSYEELDSFQMIIGKIKKSIKYFVINN